jgi:hypothetical protein
VIPAPVPDSTLTLAAYRGPGPATGISVTFEIPGHNSKPRRVRSPPRTRTHSLPRFLTLAVVAILLVNSTPASTETFFQTRPLSCPPRELSLDVRLVVCREVARKFHLVDRNSVA